jgi:radical SAM superfamily enzyme with C-terminal helix-hairpin-helix motif
MKLKLKLIAIPALCISACNALPLPLDVWGFVNRAAPEELQEVKGIGPVLSARIIAARPIKTMEELDAVKGVGPAVLMAIYEWVRRDSGD